MPEVICNTSPLQYLHQLGRLDILPALVKTVTVPPAVTAELAEGQRLGVNVPELRGLDWVTIRPPASLPALPLASDLGPGESQAIALALETEDSLIVLDDGLGRRVAEALGLRLTGTLGLLIDAKQAGLVRAIRPLLDELQALRFRLSSRTRAEVLDLAGEGPVLMP